MLELIDTHCHLTNDRLDGQTDILLPQARAAGVIACLTAGTDVADSREAAALAQKYEGLYSAAGIHPHQAKEVALDYIARLEEVIGANPSKCVAVGEMGLDYHYEFSPRQDQRRVFTEQLEMAARLKLPAIIHSREALEDTLAILAAFAGRLSGVIHSFTGNEAEAKRFLDQGWHIGFAGIITFKRSEENRAAAKIVPPDRLLVETDAPYLSPEPVRKVFPNVPAHVVHTARLLAEVRGVPFEELAAQTTANARKLFGL